MDSRENVPMQENPGRISEETSRRITSLRYLLIVLVVFIHSRFIVNAVGGASNMYGAVDAFNRPDSIKWIQAFISGGIAIGSVPVFFLFSGFLQAKKNDSYGKLLRKKGAGTAGSVFVVGGHLFLSQVQKLFAWAAYLAEFSFFLYAVHLWKLFDLFQDLWLRFFPLKNGFFCLFHYFCYTALVVAIGTGMGIALKKICPPVFKLLTGGR